MSPELDNKPHFVMPLLAFAMLTSFFLFSVAYTNASFQGTERALPDVISTSSIAASPDLFAPANISPSLDSTLNTIADNLKWAVSTTFAEAKPVVVAFFGMDDYKFGMPRYTALKNAVQNSNSAVLGASISNSDYASENLTEASPRYIEIQIR